MKRKNVGFRVAHGSDSGGEARQSHLCRGTHPCGAAGCCRRDSEGRVCVQSGTGAEPGARVLAGQSRCESDQVPAQKRPGGCARSGLRPWRRRSPALNQTPRRAHAYRGLVQRCGARRKGTGREQHGRGDSGTRSLALAGAAGTQQSPAQLSKCCHDSGPCCTTWHMVRNRKSYLR